MIEITKDTIIGDILDVAPQTAPIFLSIGMHCLGCPSSRGETVEEACAVHGIDVDKLLELPEKYPDLHNMEQLHRIRIKLKRFRYALQSVPELAPEARLLRSLKYLQDMLGLLHDDYINTLMVERLVAANPKIKELRYEAALFSGWEQAKADAALEALPQQWEAFSSQLTEWKNKNL